MSWAEERRLPRADPQARDWSMAAAGTSESSAAPAGSSKASRAKTDIPVTMRDAVHDQRNNCSAAHQKESVEFYPGEQRALHNRSSCFTTASSAN